MTFCGVTIYGETYPNHYATILKNIREANKENHSIIICIIIRVATANNQLKALPTGRLQSHLTERSL